MEDCLCQIISLVKYRRNKQKEQTHDQLIYVTRSLYNWHAHSIFRL